MKLTPWIEVRLAKVSIAVSIAASVLASMVTAMVVVVIEAPGNKLLSRFYFAKFTPVFCDANPWRRNLIRLGCGNQLRDKQKPGEGRVTQMFRVSHKQSQAAVGETNNSATTSANSGSNFSVNVSRPARIPFNARPYSPA